MDKDEFYRKRIMAANHFFHKGFDNPSAVVLAKYWMILWKLNLFLTPEIFYKSRKN